LSADVPERGDAPRSIPRPVRGDGPRFDLRFEAGRGLLRLSRPLDAGLAELRQLELSLGHVSFPVDVTRGASAFRHRRTKVRAAAFHIDTRDLGRAASRLGVGLSLGDTPSEAPLSLGLRDDFGCLGLDVIPFVDERDLCFAVRSYRAVTDGPANPFFRIVELASSLGLSFDAEAGFFRFRRPARSLLALALCRRGYRLPDDRGVDLGAPRRADGSFVLELGDVGLSADQLALEATEDARLVAPALRRLAADDVEGAADEAVMLLRRIDERRGAEPALAARTLELASSIDAERPGVEADVLRALAALSTPFAAATALRLTRRLGDPRAAAEVAQKMVRVEPLSELVAEALSAVSSELSKEDPGAALALVSRAAARRPGDPRLAMERVELARRAGDPAEIERAAKKALGAPLSSRDRARVAGAAARAFERLDRRRDAERLYREALFASPDDPSALEGLAGLFAARGDRAAAVLRLDRAARSLAAMRDGPSAAAALHRAAELLVRSGKPSAAEERLVRALRHLPTDPALCCALSRVRVQVGDVDGAGAAYDLLLTLEGRAGPTLMHALVEAACFYLDDLDDRDSAGPFVEMLARTAPGDSRLGPLMHRAGRGDRTVPGAIPAAAQRRDEDPPAVDDENEPAESTATDHDVRVDVLANTELVDIDDIEASLLDDPTDPDVLSTLEAQEEEPVRRAELARALSNALRQRGDDVEAARALARAGVLERDMSTIRAALDLAERAGAPAATRDIVDRALTIVGEGPAREMLLKRRRLARDDETDEDDE